METLSIENNNKIALNNDIFGQNCVKLMSLDIYPMIFETIEICYSCDNQFEGELVSLDFKLLKKLNLIKENKIEIESLLPLFYTNLLFFHHILIRIKGEIPLSFSVNFKLLGNIKPKLVNSNLGLEKIQFIDYKYYGNIRHIESCDFIDQILIFYNDNHISDTKIIDIYKTYINNINLPIELQNKIYSYFEEYYCKKSNNYLEILLDYIQTGVLYTKDNSTIYVLYKNNMMYGGGMVGKEHHF